ncbi:MAG: hypothetical protein DRR08_15575 [Candidatus Parabeggiatoa sp. nov. 2]|nr:MAG: hypothetical protein B6247_25695 [Beggiatoa sp. 4572_84]RKZ58768.1 MAG: hypothetical protein DRR08_15575 [Gammaproteobacteria bacterium]HEC85960.1 hypothetical protein [Thioploca sp.]
MIETDAKALRTIISALELQIETYQEYENPEQLSSEDIMDIRDNKLYTIYVLGIVKEDYHKLVNQTELKKEPFVESGFAGYSYPNPSLKKKPQTTFLTKGEEVYALSLEDRKIVFTKIE